jgi:hypothetical protein
MKGVPCEERLIADEATKDEVLELRKRTHPVV